MLADGPTVDAVVREAVASAVPGTLWVQTSTVGVDWTTRLAALAADSGLVYVDAPVLGTRAPAEQGQLVVVLAGPEGARAICEAVLPAIARKLVWLGDEIGSASALKLVLNHWILNSLENVAETVAFAQALGVEPERFLESISGGQMDMPYAHMKTEAIVSGNIEPSFTLRLAAKDVEPHRRRGLETPGIDLALARRCARADARARSSSATATRTWPPRTTPRAASDAQCQQVPGTCLAPIVSVPDEADRSGRRAVA